MTETWAFRYESANGRGMAQITMPLRSSIERVKAALAERYPGWSVTYLGYLGPDDAEE